MNFHSCKGLQGEITVPGDKSISHRSVMFGSIAQGITEIHNYLQGADCLSTISCFEKMGITIENKGSVVLVHGCGLRGLTRPTEILDCGNSGTTTRLLSGILAGQNFDVTLTGDASIRKRPMRRIIKPLSQMGADIKSISNNDCAPLAITGKPLSGTHYTSPVASAQVKSSILLAGLYADGETRVTEPFLSRNHSELLLHSFGAAVRTETSDGQTLTDQIDPQALHGPVTAVIQPAKELYGCRVDVPGDISSAAFFICSGLMVPQSEILIRNVGINPTRDGILRVCKAMGADLTLLNEKNASGEPTADIFVRSSSLHGTDIGGSLIPTLIDELPMIAAMACFAEGDTVIRDAAELKVKESNRIRVMTEALTSMGADVEETEDGMVIHGGRPLHGAVIDSHFDHRIAMTFAVTSLCAEGETTVKGAECVNISYPHFYEDLNGLMKF